MAKMLCEASHKVYPTVSEDLTNRYIKSKSIMNELRHAGRTTKNGNQLFGSRF